MKNITISIIIPIYNVERYLEECLESVVNQSDSFDEVLLINDGSTDNSLLICERYTSLYNNIKLINKKNEGPSIARNIGMQYASGDYIMFLDSDDFLRLDSVKILKNHLQKIEFDALFFDAKVFVEADCTYSTTGKEYDRKCLKIDNIEISGLEYFKRCYPQNYVASACMAIYNKQSIEEMNLRFPERVFYEDTYFSFAFALHAKHVMYVSEDLYQRRYRNGSTMTSKFSLRKFIDRVKIGILIWKEIIEIQDGYLVEYQELFLNFVSDYFSMVIDNYQLLKITSGGNKGESKTYLVNLSKEYISVIKKLYLNIVIDNLPLLKKLLNNLHLINCENLFFSVSCINLLIFKVIKEQEMAYIALLNGLPLKKENVIVGLYGAGKHTEGLLAIYEKLFGEIKCELIFIDSYIDDTIYKNRKVIHYRKIHDDFDLIIISSFLYEKEMIDNLRNINKDVSIYRFYKNIRNDIFSDYKIFLQYLAMEK